MKTLYIIFTFLPLLWPTLVYPQAGSLDPEFGGGDGLVSTSFVTNRSSQGWHIAFQDDEKILVSGFTLVSDNQEAAVVARYRPDGTLDDSFNGNGKIIINIPGASAYSRNILVQPDGKILVSLIATEPDVEKLVLCRFLTDGTPDNSFDEDGKVITSLNSKYLSGNGLAIQADGKIVAAGDIGFENDDTDQIILMRYLSDGTLDESFDDDGIVKTSVGEQWANIYSIVIQPDGKIIAAGYAVFDENDDFMAIRYNTNGTVDQDFGDEGVATVALSNEDDRAFEIALQPDGKIVLGGYAFNASTNSSGFAVARFNSNGTIDNNFHEDGMNIITLSDKWDAARAMLIQPDGKIVLGGYAHSSAPSIATMALVRLNPNGTPDNTFDNDGKKVYDENSLSSSLSDISLQPDGKIVGAGYVSPGQMTSLRVARFISGLTTSTSEAYMPVVDISLYPNPINDHVTINYELDRDETILINLYDLQGKMIQNLLPYADQSAGNHVEKLTIPESIPMGTYFLTLESEDWMKSMKVIKE